MQSTAILFRPYDTTIFSLNKKKKFIVDIKNLRETLQNPIYTIVQEEQKH